MTKKILIAIAVIIVAALMAVSVYFAFNDTTYEVTVVKMERFDCNRRGRLRSGQKQTQERGYTRMNRERIKEVIKQANVEYHRLFREGVGRVRRGELKSFSTRDIKPYDDVLADALVDAVGKDSKCHDVCEEFAEETKKLMQRIFGDYIAKEMSGFIDEIKEKMERKHGD